jgi:long-chain acyl-CoA synthetase
MQQDWLKQYPADVPHSIDISREKNIASLIEQACLRFSDHIALTCMGAHLTYREFDRYANHFASFLQNHIGVKKGDRLAIMLPNIMQFPIVFYAAQKIGAVCVCTNPLYTPREMKYQFKDSGATAIVILDLFTHHLESIIKETDIQNVVVTSVGDQLPILKSFIVKTVLKLRGQVPKHHLKATSFKVAIKIGAQKPHQNIEISQEDLAILQYTGGTTGVSKGAMLLQKNILSNIAQIKAVASSQVTFGEEKVLTALPLYHIFALSVNFLTFLTMGHQMILVPRPIPITNVLKIFKQYQITVLTGVNTLFNALVNHPKFGEHPPKTLKIALGGGMAVQDAVNKKWTAITGKPIIEGFGLTEASPVTHVNPLTGPTRISSIGLPLPSTLAKIVDENGKEVPVDQPGELIIKGPQVMAGYWQKPEETQKTIKDGWLFTGDIARRDSEGFFFIVDRKKDMILVSGFNVFPNEVEEVIASHPKVMECAVVGVPDSNSGEAVKAFVVPRDSSLSESELRKYCEENLTNYKRPKIIVFRKDLPKTNVGKILRRELKEPRSA